MNIRVRWAGKDTEIIQEWLNNLSTEQKEELARLDYHSGDHPLYQAIAKDWIEEHDGQRYYWGYIVTRE